MEDFTIPRYVYKIWGNLSRTFLIMAFMASIVGFFVDIETILNIEPRYWFIILEISISNTISLCVHSALSEYVEQMPELKISTPPPPAPIPRISPTPNPIPNNSAIRKLKAELAKLESKYSENGIEKFE